MPIPRNLRTATVRQLLDDFADLEARDLVQILAALRREVGLEILPAIASVLAIQRDEWLEQVRAGRAFAVSRVLGASVGNFSIVQLFNPAASTVNLLVAVATGSLSVTDRLVLKRHNAAFTAGTAPSNLLIGGAAAVAEQREAQQATVPGTILSETHVLANTQEPGGRAVWLAEVPPGQSLYLTSASVNIAIAGNYLWAEVPV